MSGSPGAMDEALARLFHQDVKVRRIAVRDLGNAPSLEGPVVARLIAMLETERDESLATLVVELIGRRQIQAGRPALVRLMESPQTPVRLAHAARIALDRLDIGARAAARAPGPEAGAPGTMGP